MVPRNAHDAGRLGDWIAAIRRLHRQDRLPAAVVSKLDALDMQWSVDVLEAKWHSNFHTAREFREIHSGGVSAPTCDLNVALPADFDGGEEHRADWIEAARWLQRQRYLFETEKLTDYRVWALKKVLGKGKKKLFSPPMQLFSLLFCF